MSNWNGHPLPERRDTVASRCMDIIERGMKRYGIERAPAVLNRVHAAVPAAERAPRRIWTDAELVEHWAKLPAESQKVTIVARDLRVSELRLRTILFAAGVRGIAVPPRKIHPATRAAALRQWQQTPPQERNVNAIARAHNIRPSSFRVILGKAGIYHLKAKAAA